MLTILFVLYYFSRFWLLTYLILSYFTAWFLFIKSTKFHFPNLKEKDNFHEEYVGFNRTDGHHLNFLKIFYGVLNYLWIRIFLFALVFLGFYIFFK